MAATTAVGAAAAGAAVAGLSAAARDARLLLYRSTALTEGSAPVGATFTVDDVWKPPRHTASAARRGGKPQQWCRNPQRRAAPNNDEFLPRIADADVAERVPGLPKGSGELHIRLRFHFYSACPRARSH